MTPSFPAINPGFLTEASDGWPVEELTRMGYRGLELTPVDIRRLTLQNESVELGLPVVCVNAIPDLSPYLTGSLNDAVAWRRRRTIDGLAEVLSYMDRVGIPFMVVSAGRVAENYQTREEATELLVSALRELALKRKAEILLESVPFRLLTSSTEIATIVERVGLPNLGAALDVGHAMLCGEDPLKSAEVLGKRLRYIQIRDVDLRPGRARLDQHLPLGTGSAEIPKLRRLTAAGAWSVCITAPASPIEEAARTLSLMTQGTRE